MQLPPITQLKMSLLSMRYLVFRILMAFVLPTYLIIFLSSASPSSVISHSLHQGKSFRSGRHGMATAHRVSTALIPQIRDTGHITAITHPEAGKDDSAVARTAAPQLSNVVRIPPPTTTDPTAIEGISDDGANKPDANGAGGSVNYFETVNSSLAILDRSGNLEYTTTFQQWFGLNNPMHDPVVIWDNTGGRFIFSVDLGYELFLSVAQQSDALGNFCNYTFPTPGNYGADFDKLGVNSAGVYLSANLLNPNTGNLVSNELFFANRTQLESCVTNENYTSWTGLTNPDGSLASAIVPSVMETGSGNIEYLVNSYPGGACQLTLWTLTTSNAQLSNATIPTQCYSPPPFAQQKGSKFLLGTGDCSLTQASYLSNLLTIAMPGAYDWGNGHIVSIVEWFVLNTTSASVFRQGAFGTPGFWLFFPAAVRNSQGHMLFVYNVSGPSVFPSIEYVNQNPSNTVALAQGVSYYALPTGSPWGDYNSAWLDTTGSNPNAVWITGEYANATNSWGTKLGLVTP